MFVHNTTTHHGATKAVILASALVGLVLSGCGIVRTDVTFLQGGRWKASVRMTIPAQVLSMYGGEAGIDSLLQQQAGQNWQQAEQVMKKERGKDGSVTYVFNTEGAGLDDLNEKAFEGLATISQSPDGEISFSYSPGLGAQMYGLSITGGRIISGNADEVKGNTAIWHDLMRSGSAQVVVTEASGLGVNLGLAAAGVALVAVALGVVLWSRKRERRPAAIQAPESTPVVYCMRCGARAIPGAKFCASCGAEIAPGDSG